MAWEKLSAKVSKRVDTPALSIQKNGRIAWNLGAQKALGDPEFVELLIDRKGKRLGLRLAERREDHFPVRKAKNQNTWGISAWGVLSSAGLTVDSAYRRYAKESDKVVFIDIADLLKEQLTL